MPGATGDQSGPSMPPLPPPDDAGAASVLDEAYAEAAANDWVRRAAALRAELEAETDRQRAALLAYELGELSERRLRDEAGAVKAFGRALQFDPSLRPNLWAIRRVFYRRSLWPNLQKLLDAEIRFARSDHERADLLVEKAHILEDKLDDRGSAREAYEKAIGIHAQHLGALLGRERQALIDKDNDALLRVWDLLADATTSPARKVGYLIDRARLLAALALAGPPDNCRTQLQEALDVIAEAGSFAGSPGVDPALIAHERERIAELSGDPEDILAASDVRVALLAREPDRGREIAALRRRQARVARARGDRAAAIGYLKEAVSLSGIGEAPLLAYDLADIAEELRGDAAVEATVASAIEMLLLGPAGGDPAGRLALGLRRAAALERAGLAEDAAKARTVLGDAAPGFLPLLWWAERDAFAAGDLMRVAAVRLDEAQAIRDGAIFGPGSGVEPEDVRREWAAAAQVSAGDLYALDLGRDEEARAAYERALQDVPAYGPALEALVALHLAAGRGHEAVVLLERALESAPSPRTIELLERLALHYEEQSRPADAIGALERLLQRKPEDALARHRLADLYAAAGRHADRAALLDAIAEDSDDAERKAALYFEVARIKEDLLADPAGAISAYRAALALTPRDPSVRTALSAALRRAGRWEELAAHLGGDAESDPGEGGRRALREAAHVFARRLGRSGDAAELWRDLIDRSPDDVAAARGLATSLAGRPEEAATALEREVSLLEAQGESLAAAAELMRLGEVYEGLGRADDAAAAFRRARELGDKRIAAHAHTALAELGARAGDRQLIAEALAGLASETADDVVRADLREELAWLGVDDVAAAAERFDEVARAAPDRRGAQLGRALVAARRRDARELSEALTAQAERTSDAQVALALLLRAAALVEVARDEGAATRAAELAARALALAPDDPGAIIAAAERPAHGDDAVARGAVLERRAALSDDPRLRAAVDLERAEVLERAGRLADAGAVLLAILKATPAHLGALYALRRVARRGNDLDTLARASWQLGQSLTDPALSSACYAQAAELLDGELRRPDDAAQVWRQVFELDAAHPVAFRRAHELFARAGDSEGLIGILSRKIDSLGPSATVVPHRMERAALNLKREALDAAGEDLESVLELEPGHAGALLLLSEVRAAEGDRRSAAELLGQYNETVTDPEQRAEGELRLARILEELGDRQGAIDALDMVLTARSDDVASRERLVALLIAESKHARAAEELERVADRRTEATARARDHLAAARRFRDEARDTARARAAYEKSLAADPLGLEALRELTAISDGAHKQAMLERAAGEVRARLGSGETRPLSVLLEIARLSGDGALALGAAGALEVLGAAGDDVRRTHAAERQRFAAAPLRAKRSLTDDEWRARVEHPGLRGTLYDAWIAIAESAAKLAELDPAQLGFAKGDRLAPKVLAKQAPAVEAAARLLGLSEIDLYVTPGRSTYARASSLEVPLVLLSSDIARAETLEARTVLGRTLGAARLRISSLEEAPIADVALYVAAGIKAAGGDPVKVPAIAPHLLGATAKLEERARATAKVMSRKDRKTLAGLEARLAQPADLGAWLAAVRATLRRVSLLTGGDVTLAVGAARGPEVDDLIAFAVGDAYLGLRKELGLS